MQPTDGQTFLNPFGMAFTLAMGILLVVLPRRYAFLPILALVCYMTMGMRIMVGGLNFTMLRVLLIFGWFRLIVRGEFKGMVFNSIDKAILWWTAASVVTYCILWGGEYEAFKYKIGKAYDGLGFYFLFRYLIREWDDAVQMLRVAAVLVVPLAVEMVLERITLVNHFAAFGGVHPGVWVRDGTPRCQGPFSHPILAGTFGATLVPLFVGLWSQRGCKPVALLGICSATLITFTAGSSGPLFACVIGVVALCFWPLRRQMRAFRRTLSALLVFLHLVMKAPVWFLIGRFSVHNASDGFHRAQLIDRAIANLGEWWLVGTKSTAHWGYYMFDVTNQYILVGIDGGVLSLVLFITIMVRCFRGVGRLVRVAQQKMRNDLQLFAWAMGAAMMAHATSFIAVTYFDQNFIMWYLLQAMIASLCAAFVDSKLRVRETGERTGDSKLQEEVPLGRRTVEVVI